MGRLDSSVDGVAPGIMSRFRRRTCVSSSVSIPSLSFGVREMGRVKSSIARPRTEAGRRETTSRESVTVGLPCVRYYIFRKVDDITMMKPPRSPAAESASDRSA